MKLKTNSKLGENTAKSVGDGFDSRTCYKESRSTSGFLN